MKVTLRTLAAALCAITLGHGVAHAREALTLKPSSDWSIRQFEDRCRLARSFGNGEDGVDLWIEQAAPVASYNFTLIGEPLKNPFGAIVTVQFEPHQPISRGYVRATSSKGRPVLVLYGVRLDPSDPTAREQPEQQTSDGDEETVDLPDGGATASLADGPLAEPDWSSVKALQFGYALKQSLRLKPDGLEDAFAKLKSCAQRVAEQLLANTKSAAKAGTPVKTVDEAVWARVLQQNYPAHLLRSGTEGRLEIMLTVNARGRPTNCTIAAATRPQAFDDTVCLLLLQNAKFEPARDESGRAIAALYATRVTFRLN